MERKRKRAASKANASENASSDKIDCDPIADFEVKQEPDTEFELELPNNEGKRL